MIRLFLLYLVLLLNIQLKQNRIQPDVCKELSEMMVNDQKYRKQLGLQKDTFVRVFDSLKEVNNIFQNEFSNLSPEERDSILRKAREIASKQSRYSQKEKDSIWQLQNEIDHFNTKRLIEIVKSRGWITKQSLGCKGEIKTWIFFRHAPKKYFPAIRELIDLEKEENRISEYEYMVIDNHLKGRPAIKE